MENAKSIEKNKKIINQLPFIIRCAICKKHFNLRDFKEVQQHDHSIHFIPKINTKTEA